VIEEALGEDAARVPLTRELEDVACAHADEHLACDSRFRSRSHLAVGSSDASGVLIIAGSGHEMPSRPCAFTVIALNRAPRDGIDWCSPVAYLCAAVFIPPAVLIIRPRIPAQMSRCRIHVLTEQINAIRGRIDAVAHGVNPTWRTVHALRGRIHAGAGGMLAIAGRMHASAHHMNLTWGTVNAIAGRVCRRRKPSRRYE
jgi:hypothetical protein